VALAHDWQFLMKNIVLIGGSAGSIHALRVILDGLPADFPAPVLVVSHIGARESILPALLERHAALPVRHAHQGDPIVAGEVLLAPPDLHLTVVREGERGHVLLSRGPRENHARPAIDPLFRSAAAAYGPQAIGVVLSGYLDDGTVGLQAIKAGGGIAVVQDPADAEVPDMPGSALQYTQVDHVCRAQDIAPTLVGLVRRNQAAGQAGAELPGWIAVENRMLNEGVVMEELDKIGMQVALTCPECGGAIWEVRQANPLRYRCHTGHAFTAGVLSQLQRNEVEEALWAAVRAMHEQEQLFRRLHRAAQASRHGAANDDGRAEEYLQKAEQVRQQAALLAELIGTRLQGVPP
jgi:two-component system chemotaxis response regulator CheB